MRDHLCQSDHGDIVRFDCDVAAGRAHLGSAESKKVDVSIELFHGGDQLRAIGLAARLAGGDEDLFPQARIIRIAIRSAAPRWDRGSPRASPAPCRSPVPQCREWWLRQSG